MDIYLMVLRLVHVCAGVLWVGGALFMNFFIGPTIAGTEQVGKQFAGYLMMRTRLVTVMTTAAVLTIVAGGLLYWRDSQGFSSMWMTAGSGIGYGIGGVAGFTGFVFGAMFGQLNKKMAMIGSEIKGVPSPEQMTQMQKIQGRLKVITPIHVVSIIIAVIFMAIARYLVF